MTRSIPPARPLAIQSLGAFTSAGARTATGFGSARLNLKFFEELPWRDAAGQPAIGARTPLDMNAVTGVERLVTMAVLALAECSSGVTAPPAPLLLGLPEPQPQADARFVPAGILGAICAETGALIDPTSSRTYVTGRAAIFEALEDAERLLATRTVSAVYLGGVDSLVDREPFDRLLRAGRLKTSTTDGSIPGEGAAFVRLGKPDSPDAIATITGFARSREPRTRDSEQPNNVNVGAGLAEAAANALAAGSLPIGDVGAFIHNASGDRFAFREATLAMARLRPRADPPPAVITTASCAGDLGAAYGPFALAMAAFFLHKNVTAGPATLVLGADDGSTRGAAVVTRGPRARGGG